MDSTLYNAAISGNTDVIFSYIDSKSTDQLLQVRTKNCNNFLHLASLAGKTEVVDAILSKHPLLVNEINSDGNSAIHLAAKGGHTDVLRALIVCRKQLPTITDPQTHIVHSWMNLLRWQNNENYTALHEATRSNHVEAVRLLLEHDPGFNPLPSKSNESLLYMAASRGFCGLVDLLIIYHQTTYWVGPIGRSALHGAVYCNSIDCALRLLQWNTQLLYFPDNYGWPPLSYAAHLGYGNLVAELLKHVDSSSEGMFLANKALLVAASGGHVSVMKQLILHSPSCWDTVDAEERNVLHYAIMFRKKDVIEYLLDECSTIVGILLAQKDNQGNTPLHVLVICNFCVPKLIHHSMADKEAINYNGSTPLNLGTSDAKNEVVEELKRAGAISHSQNSSNLAPVGDEVEAFKATLIKVVENHMIVAALIATVAFTAGFAMPGGYVSSGSPNAGTAVLSRNSVAFQTFVISDVVALLFSSSALFTYFISAIFEPSREDETDMLTMYALAAMVLNMFGLGSIIVAFISGTYAVLHYSYALAIASSVVASCTFLIHFGILVHYIMYFKDQ